MHCNGDDVGHHCVANSLRNSGSSEDWKDGSGDGVGQPLEDTGDGDGLPFGGDFSAAEAAAAALVVGLAEIGRFRDDVDCNAATHAAEYVSQQRTSEVERSGEAQRSQQRQTHAPCVRCGWQQQQCCQWGLGGSPPHTAPVWRA